VIGSLCVIDTKPRPFDEEDRRRLQGLADALMTRMEMARVEVVRTDETGPPGPA
jgi:GAF domain-containing protein